MLPDYLCGIARSRSGYVCLFCTRKRPWSCAIRALQPQLRQSTDKATGHGKKKKERKVGAAEAEAKSNLTRGKQEPNKAKKKKHKGAKATKNSSEPSTTQLDARDEPETSQADLKNSLQGTSIVSTVKTFLQKLAFGDSSAVETRSHDSKEQDTSPLSEAEELSTIKSRLASLKAVPEEESVGETVSEAPIHSRRTRSARRVASRARHELAPSASSLAKVANATRARPLRVRRLRSSAEVPKQDVTGKASPSPEGIGRTFIETVSASSLQFNSIDVHDQPPIASLAYGLDRVLFNPGVYQLQDPRSRVYNFDPYLQKIMPVAEFNFNALRRFVTSSKDRALQSIATKYGKKYLGSSSSMTSALAHFHYLLSRWRSLDTSTLSHQFPIPSKTFTAINKLPVAFFLKWNGESYAIDADKEFDSANILSMLGMSMEKFLTLPTEEYERFRKSHPDAREEELPQGYHYSEAGDFLMRSQLDAHDKRLPGTGSFDLKTRAVVSIRMELQNYEAGMGYEILHLHGEWQSYEREYYDMIRTAFLKYSLQVRMGKMDGIFVAYHNIERIFGFQYISLAELDSIIHGTSDSTTGDREFRLSLKLLNEVLNRATARYPKQSLRIHLETRDTKEAFMYAFAQPVTEEEITAIQSTNQAAIEEFEQKTMGLRPIDEVLEESESEGKSNVEWEDMQAGVEDEMIHDEHTLQEAGATPSTAKPIATTSGDSDNASDPEGVGHVDKHHGAQSGVEKSGDQAATAEDGTTKSSMPAENRTGEATVNETARGGDTAVDLGATGDAEWLEHVGKQYEKAKQNVDVLAMTLLIRNKVNEEHVSRPVNLTDKDKWLVEYSLTEIPSEQRAQSLYAACMLRRKKGLEKAKDNNSISFDAYLNKLHQLSTDGRTWRKQRDELDRGLDKVVLDGEYRAKEP